MGAFVNNSDRIMDDSPEPAGTPANRIAEHLRRHEQQMTPPDMLELSPDIQIPEDVPPEPALVASPEPFILEDSDWQPEPSARNTVWLSVLAVLALAWISVAAWLAFQQTLPSDAFSVVTLGAALLAPLLFLAVLALIITRRSGTDLARLAKRADAAVMDTRKSLDLIVEAEARLSAAMAALRRHSEEAAALSETSTASLLAVASRIEDVGNRIVPGLRASGETASEALSLIDALEKAAPRLDSCLSEFAGSLVRCGEELTARGTSLDDQMQQAAEKAEAARLQLTEAHDAAVRQIESLRSEARETSEEMTSMAELAAARIDFTLERARGAASEARDRLESHSAALDTLVDRNRSEVAAIAGESVTAFEAAMGSITARIAEADKAIVDHGERAGSIIAGIANQIESASGRFTAFEREAGEGRKRIGQQFGALEVEIRKVEDSLAQGQALASAFTGQAEKLLVALDSGVREMDESLPGAFDRIDGRMDETRTRLDAVMAGVSAMQANADSIIDRLEAARLNVDAQAQAIAAAMAAGDTGLEHHRVELAAIEATLEANRATIATLIDEAAPALINTLRQARDDSSAMTDQIGKTIDAAIADAAGKLAEAGGSALETAIGQQVSQQIGQIADIADNAVKTAHRATDHLLRQMLSLSDSATDLESRIASVSAAEESRQRDYLTERSAQIIAVLQDSAIDVSKWLGAEISDRDWTAYLNGDKSLFVRRAVRLLSGGEARRIHALYQSEPQLQDHVSRYVSEFEAMLSDVLAGRNGNSLAVAMLSSDIGKLYIALAQAIDRLKIA